MTEETNEVEYNLNEDGTYMNAVEIVADIIANRLDDSGRSELTRMKTDDLISLHHSLGQWIRNSYGLWCEDNALTDNMDGQADNHPDQYSFAIIETLHTKLNTQSPTAGAQLSDV